MLQALAAQVVRVVAEDTLQVFQLLLEAREQPVKEIQEVKEEDRQVVVVAEVEEFEEPAELDRQDHVLMKGAQVD